MTDIARLGIEVDPKQLAAAVIQLDKLSVAAGKAEVEAKKLEKAQTSASLATARAGQASAAAAAALARGSSTASAAEKTAAADTLKQANASLNAARASDAQAAASLKAAQAALQQSEAAQRLVTANQAAADSSQTLAAANDRTMRNMGRLAGQQQANMSNIAAQFQDIGVTAAMGMNPMMIGLQQGAQLTGVWGSITGTTSEKLKTFAGSLSAVLSPMSLLIIGLTAGLAALIQFVDWTDLAKTSLYALANGLDAIAPYAFAAGAALTIAFAPAVLSSVWAITAAVGVGLVNAFATATMAMISFSLANPLGAFMIAIALTLTAVYLFRDKLKEVFGFDIVKVVKDVAEFIIDAFGAAFDTVKMLWDKVTSMDGDFSIVDTFMESFAERQKTSAIDAGIEWGKNFVSGIADTIRGMAGRIGLGGDKKTKGAKTPKGQKTEAEKFSDLMTGASANLETLKQEGEMIGMVGAAADYAAARYDLMNKAKAQGIDLSKEGRQQQIEDMAFMIAQQKQANKEAQWWQDLIDLTDQQSFALERERGELKLTGAELIAYRWETEKLAAAKRDNINLSPAELDAIHQSAQLYGEATYEIEKHKKALDFAKGAAQGFVGDLKSGLMQGKSLWEAWGNAAMNVLNKVIDKLLTDMVDAIFKVNSASKSGGGGILGSLLQIFGAGSSISGMNLSTAGIARSNLSVGNTIASNSSMFANGGAFTNGIVHKPTHFFAKGGSPGVMGEAGPEAIMPLQRGPDGSLGVQMYGGNAVAATPAVVHIVPSEYFDAVVDQRAANVAAPMVVQGSMAATKMSETTMNRQQRRRLR